MSDTIKVHYSDFEGDIRIAILEDTNGKRYCTRAILERVEVIPGAVVDAAFKLDTDEAQQLMNELWRVGIRPKNGEGSNAQVNALKAHLDDMRRLVFKTKS